VKFKMTVRLSWPLEDPQLTCNADGRKFQGAGKGQGSDGGIRSSEEKGKCTHALTTKTWGYQERKVKERSSTVCLDAVSETVVGVVDGQRRRRRRRSLRERAR